MASPFVPAGVDRIELDCGWVEVKKALSYGDLERLAAQGDKGSGAGILAIAIVAWSFTDENGQSIPITSETISRLRADIGARLLQEVLARNPFLTSLASPKM